MTNQPHPTSGTRRVAFASLMYETNTFAPGPQGLDAFRASTYADGAEVLTVGQGLDSIAGALAVARANGVDVVPTTAAGAMSGPTVAAGVYPFLRDRLLAGLAPLRGQVDGIYLQLHGAMVAEDEPDVEGDLLSAVADLMGVPVAASFDLHCHFTARMAGATPLIAGYHTLPHVDMVSTGERAMRLLLAALDGARPVIAWRNVPMITSSEGQDTNHPPISEVMARLHEIKQEPGILDASLFMTQPWLDVPELGWTAVVVADGAGELAQRRADEIAQLVWDRRHRVLAPKLPIDEALVRAAVIPAGRGPVVIGDGADSVSAGSTGDGAEVLAALSRADLTARAQVIVTDAPAARRLAEAGIGSEVTLRLGGRLAPQFHTPVEVTGTVVTVTNGRYESLYPPVPVDLGTAVVLRVGRHLHVVVTERPASQLDYQLYLHVGLDPRDAAVVVTKSAGGYRAFFEPIAAECLDVATRGPSDSRIELMPFTRVPRPLYPLDPDVEWSLPG
ncbi:M81 family metallopeptidase [Planosporangium thailandense]|uniref:M81 family metallopeptidase n=1 Tax=Planosporangium thailandense TaxID=765197 RepID=A0ABX0Y4I2_9ACTN|nr:M81 family metallopeptidase [Planosporangium thailandense]